jgi:hypothetical protein
MVIVLMETCSSADGCYATPSWPARPKGAKVSFYSFNDDSFQRYTLIQSSGGEMYSQASVLIAIICSVLATVAIVAFVFSNKSKGSAIKIQELDSLINDHQKSVHLLEAEHIKSKNRLEIEHHESLKESKERSYKEGYELGHVAAHKDHLIEITNIKSAQREELARQEAEAEKRGRAIAKMEHEAQVKAFGVEIRPYVKIEKDSGVFRDEHKSYTGYQYQLLVNGIPAFQPHVVIEHSEELRTVDKEIIAELIKLAHKSAEIAAKAYLGGTTSSALTIGQEIVQQVKV